MANTSPWSTHSETSPGPSTSASAAPTASNWNPPQTPPAKTLTPARIELISGGVFLEGLPRDRVALVAEGDVVLSETVTMDVISDDGVRVWVDGRRVGVWGAGF